MNMFLLPNVNVPVIGIVENMSWFTPAELPENKYYLFGQGGGARLARSAQAEVIAQIPIVQSVRESGDNGKPAASDPNHPLADTLSKMAKNVVKQVNVRHQLYEPTRIVKMEQ